MCNDPSTGVLKIFRTNPSFSYPFSSVVPRFRPAAFLGWLLHPLGERRDLGLGLGAGYAVARGGYGHQHSNLHVVVAQGLARKPDLPEKAAFVEDLQLGLRHPLGLAF